MNSILLAFATLDPRLAQHSPARSQRRPEVPGRIGVEAF